MHWDTIDDRTAILVLRASSIKFCNSADSDRQSSSSFIGEWNRNILFLYDLQKVSLVHNINIQNPNRSLIGEVSSRQIRQTNKEW